MGGRQTDMGAIQDLQYCISRNGLVETEFIGEIYTWCNNRQGQKRIWERLDRVLTNVGFQSIVPEFSVHHLTRISSDHSLLLLRTVGDHPQPSTGFIF